MVVMVGTNEMEN